MDLLDVTLHPSPSILTSLTGDYSRDTAAKGVPQNSEFVFAKPGGVIDLYTSDATTGALKLLASTSVFATLRSVCNYRIQGAKRDYLVVGCDSGAVTVLKYDDDCNLVVVNCEVFGKTGVRRPVPGQYVCAEPHGRAVMVAAVEKSKLVYVMNRDNEGKSVISSPLEANKGNTVTFDVQVSPGSEARGASAHSEAYAPRKVLASSFALVY